jgi:PAS domain-containing protein
MSPETIDFWKWILGGATAAVGGSPAVIKLARKGGAWFRARVAHKERVARIREDNEAFKIDVRTGLAHLKQIAEDNSRAIRRIDAELRAQVQADERPILQACNEGDVMFVNAAFTREYGWTLEHMHGLGWITNAISSVDQRRIRAQWASTVENGDFLQTDAVIVRRGGTPAGVALIEAHPKKCTDQSRFGWQIVVRLKQAA